MMTACPLRRLGRLLPVLVLGLSLGPAPLLAQQAPTAPAAAAEATLPTSPVLTIDSERLFSGSRFGQVLASKLEAEAAAIAAENRELEAKLADEERSLTQRRATMDPDAFRALAEAFDEKVTRIRKEREERAVNFGQSSDAARQQFLSAAEPVLKDIMREAGAAVMLEQHSVFLSREVVDITDEAVARIDATLLQEEPQADSDANTLPEAGEALPEGNDTAADPATSADDGANSQAPENGDKTDP